MSHPQHAALEAALDNRRDSRPVRSPPFLALPNALDADQCMLLSALAEKIATDHDDYEVTKTAVNEAQTFLTLARQQNARQNFDPAREALLRAAAIVFGAILALDKRHYAAMETKAWRKSDDWGAP